MKKTKIVNTKISTGDSVIIGGINGTIGVIKKGLISVHFKINATSGITQQYTVKQINAILALT